MSFRYKVDPIILREKGYNTNKIRKEHIFGQSTLQRFRDGQLVPMSTLNRLCNITGCQIGDILIHVPDDDFGPNTNVESDNDE